MDSSLREARRATKQSRALRIASGLFAPELVEGARNDGNFKNAVIATMPYAHPEDLVSTDWLAAHLQEPELRLVDGSFTLPGAKPTAEEAYAARHIPGAVFFDIDGISDHSSTLPHMLPS